MVIERKIRHRFAALLLAFACFVSYLCPGTEYRFTHLNGQNSELSFDGIKCLLRDSRGFVWVGTYKGLNRFDGTRVKTFGKDDFHIASDFISSLLEDDSGNILIGTDNGLVCYDYAGDRFFVPEGGKIERVYTLSMDGKTGKVLIGYKNDGMYEYDSSLRSISPVKVILENGNEVKNIYRIAIGNNGDIWFASYCDNVYQLTAGENIARPVFASGNSRFFENDCVEGLCFHPEEIGILYIASKRFGLCEYDTGTGVIVSRTEFFPGSRPTGLFCHNGKMWVTTSQGVLVHPLSGKEGNLWLVNDINDNFSLSDNSTFGFTSYKTEEEEGIWIGTENNGVNYWSSHQNLFKKYSFDSEGVSLSNCNVRGLSEDENGVLWVATENHGLLYVRDGIIHSYSGCKDLPSSLNAVLAFGKTLWVGGNSGVFAVNLENNSVQKYLLPSSIDSFVDNRVISFFRTSSGQLLIGTSIGVLRYDEVKDSFEPITDFDGSAIEGFAEDRNGTIWIATYHNGIYSYNPGRRTIIKNYCSRNDSVSRIPKMMSSVYVDECSEIWAVSFSDGFFRYDKASDDFIQYNSSNCPNLPDAALQNVLRDEHNNLWLSCKKGLIKYNLNSGNANLFTVKDGLLNDTFLKAAVSMSDSSMAFASQDGVVVFSPEKFRQSESEPHIAITGLYLGDDEIRPDDGRQILTCNIDMTGNLTFPHNMNSFGFSFACLGDLTHAQVNISCRLDGYEESWRDVSAAKSIFYYNVPKGRYTLQVIGHSPIMIYVKPPFIESAVGISLMAFLALMVIITSIAMTRKRIHKKEQAEREEFERNQERKAVAEKLNIFSSISQEIKTPITLILNSISHLGRYSSLDSEDVNIIDASVRHMNGLVSALSDYVKVEKNDFTITRRNINLTDRISFLCSNYDEVLKSRGIQLQVQITDKNLAFPLDPGIFDKIFNNLFSYIIRQCRKSIVVSSAISGENLHITIQGDGGPIPEKIRQSLFAPFVRFGGDKDLYSQQFGFGLSLAKTLTESMDGSLSITPASSLGFEVLLHYVPSHADANQTEPMDFDREKPLVLIVEENKELQSFLKKKLKEDFNVIQAYSGEDSLNILKTYHPDIAVVEIALPGINGMELCERISSDAGTRYIIPVIILTAISNRDTDLKCYESGASLVIEKPFSVEYLKDSINATLEKRNSLRNLFSDMNVTAAAGTGLTNRDEFFHKKLLKLIYDNIANSKYSLSDMEKEMCMSHSSLSRKIKVQYGVSPLEFIRNIRLDAAAKAIKESSAKINEVCFGVGFNSPSYFAKCFKKRFGVLPNEYGKNQ